MPCFVLRFFFFRRFRYRLYIMRCSGATKDRFGKLSVRKAFNPLLELRTFVI